MRPSGNLHKHVRLSTLSPKGSRKIVKIKKRGPRRKGFLPLGVPPCLWVGGGGGQRERKKAGGGMESLHAGPSAPSHRTPRHLHQATRLSNKILFKSSCGHCLCGAAELNTCTPDVRQMFVIHRGLNAVRLFFFLAGPYINREVHVKHGTD